jgi:hypothetical protein
MSRKILVVALAVATMIALQAAPAHAVNGTVERQQTTIVVDLAPDLSVPVSCPDDALFGFAFDVSSSNGTPVGTGRTCVESLVGCDPFVAFCHQTAHATLTLDLRRGSLIVDLVLLEVLPTESSFVQFGQGTISGGTGDFAAARGQMVGGGRGTFDNQGGFTGRLIYVAVLRGVA